MTGPLDAFTFLKAYCSFLFAALVVEILYVVAYAKQGITADKQFWQSGGVGLERIGTLQILRIHLQRLEKVPGSEGDWSDSRAQAIVYYDCRVISAQL